MDGEVCPYGANCKFLHSMPTPGATAATATATTAPTTNAPTPPPRASSTGPAAPPPAGSSVPPPAYNPFAPGSAPAVQMPHQHAYNYGSQASFFMMCAAALKAAGIPLPGPEVAILDSGATHHCTSRLDALFDVRRSSVTRVRGLHGDKHGVFKEGSMRLGDTIIHGVLYIPNSGHTLISAGRLLDQFGGKIEINKNSAVLRKKACAPMVLANRQQSGLLKMTAEIKFLSAANQLKRERINRLHRKLGHCSAGKMRLVLAHRSINGLKPSDVQFMSSCAACAAGKMTKQPHATSKTRESYFFGQHLCGDNSASQPVQTPGGATVANVVLCRYSNWVWGTPLKSKADSVSRLRYILMQILSGDCEIFRSDQGSEYVNYDLGALMEEAGCVHETSCAGDSPQNGAAEKCIRDLFDAVRTSLADSNSSLNKWGEALNHACVHHNYLPCYANEDCKSPYAMRYGREPDVSRLHAFGELVYVREKDQHNKLLPRAVAGVHMGYEDALGSKGFRIWVPSKNKLIVSRDVKFMGRMYSASAPLSADVSTLFRTQDAVQDADTTTSPTVVPPVITNPVFPTATPVITTPVSPVSPILDSGATNHRISAPSSAPPATPPAASTPRPAPTTPTPTGPTTTTPRAPTQPCSRSKTRVSRPVRAPVPFTMNTRGRSRRQEATVAAVTCSTRQADLLNSTLANLFVSAANSAEKASASVYTPNNHQDAATCEDAIKWMRGEAEELAALVEQETFDVIRLEELPAGANIISARWVYKPKVNAFGLVVRYKCRIVARGFQGKEGVDYTDTYSPVAGAPTLRLFLVVVALLSLKMRYVDFKTAFLNSKVPDNVNIFVKPPPGTDCPPGCIWRLNKFLYGLKDAPLQWFRTLIKFLLTHGLKQCSEDPCLLYKRDSALFLLIAVVVDDLLIASNSSDAIKALVELMQANFRMKDLGAPSFVLGIHVRRPTPNQIYLNQSLYISNLVKRFGQEHAKTVSTPCIKDHALVKREDGDDSKPCDKPYRQLVGGLLYATLTRPDVAVAVSMLSKYLHDPSTAHWNAAIRVLRYLNTTKSLSLKICPKSGAVMVPVLMAYSDASFDTCRDTSRSRTGYVLLFAGCFFLWASRLQPVVALSSAESEYIALARAASEVIWARRILSDIGFPPRGPTTILVDNKSAIAIANMSQNKPRTKHIRRRFHWVRELIRDLILVVQHVAGVQNVADFFTKVLDKILFYQGRKFFLE